MAKENKQIIENILEIVDTEKEVWLKPDIPNLSDNFYVKIKYISPDKIEEIREKSMKITFDPKTGQKQFNLDIKKFYHKLISEIVKDWKGLTVRDLYHLLPIKNDKKIDENTEVAFSETNLKILAEHSNVFIMWIMSVVNDIDTINFNEVELEKN